MTLVTLGTVATSQTPRIDTRKLDGIVDRAVQSREAPGVLVGVASEGKLIYSRARGMADLENNVPLNPQMLMRIGSITKTFTAVLSMKLVEEGVWTLDTRARALLPDLPESWDPVTVRHLLEHSSGIPSYTDLPLFWMEWMGRPVSPRNILKLVTDLPVVSEPGKKFAYNNSGYVLLGLMLEKQEGKSYQEVLNDRILKPLGMKRTFFVTNQRLLPNRARGFESTPTGMANASYINMVWPYSAGSIESTLADLATWSHALMTGQILKPETLKKMWKETNFEGKPTEYGYGFEIKIRGKEELIGHSGGINGFVSDIVFVPSKKLTVIALANRDDLNIPQISQKILTEIEPTLKNPEPQPEQDLNPSATRKDEETLRKLLVNQVSDDEFDPTTLRQLNAAVRAQAAQNFRPWGRLEKFSFLKEMSDGKMTSREYRAQFQYELMIFRISRNAEGKITGLLMRPMP